MLPLCRCSTRVIAIGVWVLAGFVARPVHAQSMGPRMEGLAPDAQLSGGVGLGLEESLRNPFLGRVRLGLLYAFEPWMVDFGASLEAGALARLGFGAALGLGNFEGWYSEFGAVRAEGDGWVSHVALGFTVFGVEWQHRFDTPDQDALLVQLRVPLGLWWFVDRERERQQQARKATTATRAQSPWRARRDGVPVDAAPQDGEPRAAAASESPGPSDAQAAPEQVGQLRVQVEGPTDGLAAKIDGQAVPAVLLGYDVPLQPGEHELVLYAGNNAVATQRFVVEQGKLVRVTVAVQVPSTTTEP